MGRLYLSVTASQPAGVLCSESGAGTALLVLVGPSSSCPPGAQGFLSVLSSCCSKNCRLCCPPSREGWGTGAGQRTEGDRLKCHMVLPGHGGLLVALKNLSEWSVLLLPPSCPWRHVFPGISGHLFVALRPRLSDVSRKVEVVGCLVSCCCWAGVVAAQVLLCGIWSPRCLSGL